MFGIGRNCIISLDDSGSLFMICCHRLRFSLSNDKSCNSTFVSRGSVKAFTINKGVLVPFSNDQQRWHPDKCLASGNAQIVGEAKEKFQEIQKAYSGLFVFSSSSPSNCPVLFELILYHEPFISETICNARYYINKQQFSL